MSKRAPSKEQAREWRLDEAPAGGDDHTFVISELIPAAELWTKFGLIPLYGNDVWLHILLAAVAGYFGFVRRDAAGEAGARS